MAVEPRTLVVDEDEIDRGQVVLELVNSAGADAADVTPGRTSAAETPCVSPTPTSAPMIS